MFKNHKHEDLVDRSPSLWLSLVRDKSKEIRVLKRRIARHEKWKKQLLKDQVFISKNINAEVLFAEDELQRCYDELLEKEIITDDEIFHFFFQVMIRFEALSLYVARFL